MEGDRVDRMSDDLRSWVERRAEESGASPEAILARSVAAYRFLEGESDSLPASGRRDGDADPGRNGHLDAAGTPDGDGDREEATTEREYEDLERRAAEAARDAAEAAGAVERLRDRLDEGFANYEEVLEYLTETTDDLEGKLTRVARATVDVREDLRRLESTAATRAAVDELRTAANRHGERRANCGDCGATVDVALLAQPRCPHCEAPFEGLDPGSGLLSSARLTVGARPALDGEVDESVGDAADLLEADDE
jgi:hypothetical protein